jgi:hypothetical protein
MHSVGVFGSRGMPLGSPRGGMDPERALIPELCFNVPASTCFWDTASTSVPGLGPVPGSAPLVRVPAMNPGIQSIPGTRGLLPYAWAITSCGRLQLCIKYLIGVAVRRLRATTATLRFYAASLRAWTSCSERRMPCERGAQIRKLSTGAPMDSTTKRDHGHFFRGQALLMTMFLVIPCFKFPASVSLWSFASFVRPENCLLECVAQKCMTRVYESCMFRIAFG